MKYAGQDKGTGISSFSLDNVTSEMINLQNIATKGTGLYFVLQSYKSHPDYTALIDASTNPIVDLDEAVMGVFYDAIIRVKVMIQWYTSADISLRLQLDKVNFLVEVAKVQAVLLAAESDYNLK